MTTLNDKQVFATSATEMSGYLLKNQIDFSPDGWDKSGATLAVAEAIGTNVSMVFSSWENVSVYRDRQYQWADKAISDAESRIRQLSNPLSTEANVIRRTAEVTAQSMRNMGDLAASQMPEVNQSSASNIARAASYAADFAKAAGAVLTLGQMASVTYDAANGKTTTHEVLATAAGIVGGLAVGAAAAAAIPAFFATAAIPAIILGAGGIAAAFVAGKFSQDAYDKWGKGLTDFLDDTGRWWGNEIYDLLHPDRSNFITDLQSKFREAGLTISPLVLDLDADGVETIGKSAGIHFDHDGNGFAETTGWVGKDDGLLVWDRNGNGRIDDGGELFGNRTALADGSKAINGFAALAELDSNHDGIIDALDDEFKQLQVWKDIDSNATVSNGELLGLDTAGIQSINLNYAQHGGTDAQGNQHLQVGQYTRVDGSTSAVDDVWFDADMARTRAMNTVEVASDIEALPDLDGFGNVQSLHQAMARSTSGKLQALVREFMETDGSNERKAVLDDILYVWTGSDVLTANDRGSYFGDVRRRCG